MSLSNLDADFSVGSATATFTATRSASNPATYIDKNGNMQLETVSNVPRYNSGDYHSIRETWIIGGHTTFFIAADGAFWGGSQGNGLEKSVDKGVSWTIKDALVGTGGPRRIFQDSRGYIFWGPWGTGTVRRSKNNGENWADSLTFGDPGDDSGIWGFCEGLNGYLYAGIYTGAISQPEIWRSVDGGDNWTLVYTGNDKHIHDVACDPYTGYIYATFGDTNWEVVRSIDNGETWAVIYDASLRLAINFLPGMRLFGGDDSLGKIVTTTDDESFTVAYQSNTNVGSFTTWRYKGRVYFGQVSLGPVGGALPFIVYTDDGVNWQRFRFGLTTTAWHGPNFNSNVSSEGQVLLRWFGEANSSRLFDLNIGLTKTNGLLIEGSATNRCLYSEDLSQSDWVKTNCSIGAVSVETPYGAKTNITVTASAANATCLQAFTLGSANRTYSVYLQRKTGNGDISITADGTNYTVVPVFVNEWTKVNISATAANPSVGIKIAINGDEVYMCLNQFEDTLFPTSYIPTGVTTITRNKENLKYAIANNRNVAAETIIIKGSPLYGNAVSANTYYLSNDSDARPLRGFLTQNRIQPNSTDNAAVSAVSGSMGWIEKNPMTLAGVCQHSSPYAELYRDGQSIADYTVGDYTDNDWGTSFYLGSNVGNNGGLLLGAVAIFNRVLTATEVLIVTQKINKLNTINKISGLIFYKNFNVFRIRETRQFLLPKVSGIPSWRP